jgi:hypothetical protein
MCANLSHVCRIVGPSASKEPPDGPLNLRDEASIGRYVRDSLRCQAKLGASAYLVPGFIPDDRHEDLRRTYYVIATGDIDCARAASADIGGWTHVLEAVPD